MSLSYPAEASRAGVSVVTSVSGAPTFARTGVTTVYASSGPTVGRAGRSGLTVVGTPPPATPPHQFARAGVVVADSQSASTFHASRMGMTVVQKLAIDRSFYGRTRVLVSYE